MCVLCVCVLRVYVCSYTVCPLPGARASDQGGRITHPQGPSVPSHTPPAGTSPSPGYHGHSTDPSIPPRPCSPPTSTSPHTRPQSLQLWFRPYHHVETNTLEAGSICVLLLTLYLSLYFLLDASVVSNSGAIAVSAVIIGINVGEQGYGQLGWLGDEGSSDGQGMLGMCTGSLRVGQVGWWHPSVHVRPSVARSSSMHAYRTLNCLSHAPTPPHSMPPMARPDT